MSEARQDRPILVVDDDRVFGQTLAAALRRRGHAVVLAEDYASALDEASAWRPDRAVVDLRMPGRGGLELIPALRSAVPDLRVLVLTGFGSIETAVEAMRVGASNYLTKPAAAEQILEALGAPAPSLSESGPYTKSLQEVEWDHIQRVLAECQGNVSEAARRLGMHRRSLQRKLARGAPEPE